MRISDWSSDVCSSDLAQVAGVQGVAVAGQAVAAVVVDHRGDEMQLDVGAIVGGERREQECAAFGDVAGARPPAAAQDVVACQLKFAGPVGAGAPGPELQGP